MKFKNCYWKIFTRIDGTCHGKIGQGKTGPAGPILDVKTGPN